MLIFQKRNLYPCIPICVHSRQAYDYKEKKNGLIFYRYLISESGFRATYLGLPSFLPFRKDVRLTLALSRTSPMIHNFYYKSNNDVFYLRVFLYLLKLTKFIKKKSL